MKELLDFRMDGRKNLCGPINGFLKFDNIEKRK